MKQRQMNTTNKRQKSANAKHGRGASAVRSKRAFTGFHLPSINMRAIAIVFFLGCVGTICYFSVLAMNHAAEQPITSVAIEGKFNYVSQEEVEALVQPLIADGFLKLPLMSVKQKLEQHPWIAEVNISRRWPNTLLVAITEQQAIARWSDTGFLNQLGEIIAVEQTPVLAALPWLDGKPEEAKLLMQRYQQFSQLLRPHGLNIATFQADQTNAMTVTLSNGLIVYLGKDEVMEKFQRFLLVMQRNLKDRLNEVAAVDLRYDNGVAVQWQTIEAPVDSRVANRGL